MGVNIIGGSISLLRVSGEIDVSNVSELQSAIERALIESPDGFIIDLSDVSYVDSAGVAAIMFAYRRLYPPGRLALVVANEQVKGILTLIHIERLPGIHVCDDSTEAEQALSTSI